MFSYSIGHDLKAPVEHTQSFIQQLETKHWNNFTHEGKMLFSQLSEATKNVKSMLQSMLSYLEQEKMPFHYSTIDLQQVVAPIV